MSAVVSNRLPLATIMYLIHHMFLPPKLPDGDDYDSKHEAVLLDTTVDGLKRFKDFLTSDQQQIIDPVIAMVTNMRIMLDSSNPDGGIMESELRNALRSGTITLHIRAQNAGVMISQIGNSVNFEAFEISPLNAAVINTKGRLRRCFPGLACAVSIATFDEPGFQTVLVSTLAKMSRQPAPGTKTQARKAGQLHDEDRDPTHPKIISELFMGFLRSVGKTANVSFQWKNTREEVMWLDSLLPWRRSPMWLLLRVAMQLVFTRLTASLNCWKGIYKFFMTFLMSHTLQLSSSHSLPSDLLYAMNAKLARRLLKLDVSADEPGFRFIQSVMQNTNKLIHTRWSLILETAGAHHDLSNLRRLNFTQDIVHTLPALDDYIKSLAGRKNSTNATTFQPKTHLTKYQAQTLPTCSNLKNKEYEIYNLRAFEEWVVSNLPQWMKYNKGNFATCGNLGDLIQTYHGVAFSVYESNPEAVSIMILTIIELWIACDESATHICALLLDYDPGIPKQLLQSLVLPLRSQMERLLVAEDFLSRRQGRAKFGSPSIFRDFGLQNSFSVRYFDQCLEQKDLLESIEKVATQNRHAKCDELDQKKERHKSLMELYHQATCDYILVKSKSDDDLDESIHSSTCKKCNYLSQANSITIRIHEWPLPSKVLQAKSTVFELRLPTSFGSWRDATVFILLDVLRSKHSIIDKPQTKYSLQHYQGLSSFILPGSSSRRIGLSSQTKPHEATHRRKKSIGTIMVSAVCLANGMSYQYYENTTGVLVNEFLLTNEIPNLCTYKLPRQSESVQRFLYRPSALPSGPSSNTVIASQSACPDHVSLDEYKALCTISLGYRIQWQNILLQLSAPSVDIKKVETSLMILQSIYQTGRPSHGHVLRASHQVLDDESFAHALLLSLNEFLQKVKENWESSQALSIFVSLVLRILSLTSTEQIRDDCLSYLASARAVAFGWVKDLRNKAHKVTNDNNRTGLLSNSVGIALICAHTFNVDERYLADTITLPDNASVFLQCSIIIQEGIRTIQEATNLKVSLLYHRWKLLSYRSYGILVRQIISAGSQSLDDAISSSWPAFQAGNRWQTISEQVDYWLFSHTLPESGCDELIVHFNLLTGELLVNGLPLARLPSKYEENLSYRTLFGHSVLEVMPTAVQGMQFSGRNKHAGFTLHLGIHPISNSCMAQEHDLLVYAVKESQTYELFPSRILRSKFPAAFVDNFVHWYNPAEECLEFRPIAKPWTSSLDNWRLSKTKDGLTWHLTKHGMSLVSVNSKTAKELSAILSPIEDLSWLHIIFHHSSTSLEVELSRLRLGFRLKSGESSIRSRQFRGKVIDSNQFLGTLIGLRNRLILKDENDGSRFVVIPEGTISCKRNTDHVSVSIKKNCAVKAHAYALDNRLGRLVDNGSLQSKLLLCYLHALTSYCLPDPLMQRTGTEQALSVLDSAAVRSFDRLTQENVDLLYQIACLTPGRSYYPANERVMQVVRWSPVLGFLSQHGNFYKIVRSIFSEGERAQIFYPESYVQPPKLDHVAAHLLYRDLIRSSTFRVAGFGAEYHTATHDVTYDSRDRNQSTAQGSRVFTVSSIIHQSRTPLHYNVSFDLRDHLWQAFSKTSVILGQDHPLKFSELVYDAQLLLDTSEFLSRNFCLIQRVLNQGKSRLDKFSLMVWFATLAFAENVDMKIVQTLASFFTMTEMAQILPPSASSFHLSQGFKVRKAELYSLIRPATHAFRFCPEAELCRNPSESQHAFQSRKIGQFKINQKKAVERLGDILADKWPCEAPPAPSEEISAALSTYVNVSKAMNLVRPNFKIWYDNHLFHQYLGQIGDTLSLQVVDPVKTHLFSFEIPTWTIHLKKTFVSMDDVLSFLTPAVFTQSMPDLKSLLSSQVDADAMNPRLPALIDILEAQAGSNYEKTYIKELKGSLLCLQSRRKDDDLNASKNEIKKTIFDNLERCKEQVQKIYDGILSPIERANEDRVLSPQETHDPTLIAASIGQWPRVSPIFFLQQLTRTRWSKLSIDWKNWVVQYGLTLAQLQRAERLAASLNNHIDFVKELLNPGHTNWSPFDYPESLLLEVESGIMIRDVQMQIAEEMMYPKSDMNAVMQLNMGEGKSSVIAPIVAAALADGSRLVRVIVAKPQSKQMVQMLVAKLSGLLNRRVYHLPFSRSLRLGEEGADKIGNICKECMIGGGILLVRPEHILSLKLMGIECRISGKENLARSLLGTQEFLDTSSRDIVDESDENFSVKFELIYTMGMQRPIELSPERWSCIHQVLDLMKRFAPIVEKDFPQSMEINQARPGGFARTRFLQFDAQQRILDFIAERICEAGLTGFPIARQPQVVRRAVHRYITELDLTTDEIAQVENQGTKGFWGETTKDIMLLLRGLMAGGVLAFAFGQKRWKVNYGLDATRQPQTRLAVPYRAKDSPAPRSEFSHPDVVIVLTSLSHYYGGLQNEDLFMAFDHLLKSDHADVEYQAWINDISNLPPAFRQLVGINLTDRFQCIEQVFPPLRSAKTVIDYFLAHIVFPKEMKEFPHKLSTSGWDLGQKKAHPTTGFSGTNDSRKTLPLDMQQIDLPEQKHTNALVLEHLLRPENSVALMPRRTEASTSDAELLLAMVAKMTPPAQVILDVGAQILELSNLGFAKEWLKMVPDNSNTQAVLFFNDDDELSVLDHHGHIEALQTSAFAKQLDVCLIFLDEVHTRGIDLRLPEHYRAAVTLGANLTKDRLVQACMRMRKLGKGQSVVFCVPSEIETKILGGGRRTEEVEVSDVLAWAISETCIDMRRSMPLWANQGQRYEAQEMIWTSARASGKLQLSQKHAEEFLEDEAQSLEQRYRPRFGTGFASAETISNNDSLNRIRQRCEEFEGLKFNSATLQEEQERELAPEIEQERQVQRPAPVQPEVHLIHPDVLKFISTGMLTKHSPGYKPAFDALCDTSAAKHLDVSQFGDDLLVTTDFANTVQIPGASYCSDVNERPVQWILTSAADSPSSTKMIEHMMIISPYEAQELLPAIEESQFVALHLYAPRPNLGFRALDGLDLYTVPARLRKRPLPRRLIILLNLFSGQLYLSSFKEYVEVCEFLGLAWKKTEEGLVVAPDGFILQDDGGQRACKSTFHNSPVQFLKVLMTKVRRNCEEINRTHMGTILDGRVLRPADFGEPEADF